MQDRMARRPLLRYLKQGRWQSSDRRRLQKETEEGNGGRLRGEGDEQEFSWHVYCCQFQYTHSIWELISCQIGKAMGMWGLQESQQGLKLARHWDLIKTQSRSLPEPTRAPTPFSVPPHFFLFYTNTFRQMHILSHTHTHREKNINLKSHMDKHILSHAIRLRPISNHPELRGRKTMYKSQCNMLAYLWLWPMTWVYLHYTVAHSKSFTSVGDYWHERRKRQQPRCCIYGSVQTLQPFSLMPRTVGPACAAPWPSPLI